MKFAVFIIATLKNMEDNTISWQQVPERLGKYWQDKVQSTRDEAFNTFSNKIDKVQDSLANSWQNITEIKNSTSGVIESAVSDYFGDLVTQNPTILKILQILNWAIIHPIISVILLLFIIAFLWSIIKGIVRLIETASWSILKVPLKLFQIIITSGFSKLFQLFKNNPIQKKGGLEKNNQLDLDLNKINFQDKQKRLIEINHRLELINQEQQELLKEAANIINSEQQNLI